MFCIKCGAELEKDSQYCVMCGAAQNISRIRNTNEKKQFKWPVILLSMVIGITVLSGTGIAFISLGLNNEKKVDSVKQEKATVRTEGREGVFKGKGTDETLKQEEEYTPQKGSEVENEQVAVASRKTKSQKVSIEQFNRARIQNKYADALSMICLGGHYPTDDLNDSRTYNGNLTEYEDQEGNNTFAMKDVDGDGVEELIISIKNECMAGMTGNVYHYDIDTDTLIEEIHEFPSMKFYEGGVLTCDFSHNQGYSVIIWPYNLYKYNAFTHKYDYVASVDSWNEELAEIKDGYYKDFDKDNDGNVYTISKQDVRREQVMDNEEYNRWYRQNISGEPIDLSWKKITSESIDKLVLQYQKVAREYAQYYKEDNVVDVGEIYMESRSDSDITMNLIEKETKHHVNWQEQKLDDWVEYTVGIIDGKEVFSFHHEDGELLSYKEAVDDIRILGLAPGMSVDEVEEILGRYGFYMNRYGYYSTGDSMGSYAVDIREERGVIQEIKLFLSCLYAG